MCLFKKMCIIYITILVLSSPLFCGFSTFELVQVVQILEAGDIGGPFLLHSYPQNIVSNCSTDISVIKVTKLRCSSLAGEDADTYTFRGLHIMRSDQLNRLRFVLNTQITPNPRRPQVELFSRSIRIINIKINRYSQTSPNRRCYKYI